MLRVDILFLILYIFDSTLSVDNETRIQSCQVGDVVQNDCVQCVCTTKHIYKCTPMNCSSNTGNIHLNETNKAVCKPSMVYTTDTTTCICNKTGYWPHNKCERIFQTLNDTTDTCEANSYVILDCNVCRCSPEGRIDKKRCTTNICDNKTNSRRYMSNVYGSCEIKNWYSLAPCQFCYCVSYNKLVCNTGNNYAKKLDLGSYHLNVCGQGLIYEAIALIPDNDLTLRIGNLINTTDTTPLVLTTPKHVKLQENQRISIEVNKGNKIDEKNKEESYSESEEDKPLTPNFEKEGNEEKKVNEVAITQLPYSEEGDDTSKDNSLYSDKKDPDSGVEIEQNQRQSPKKVIKTTKKYTSPTPKPQSEEELKSLGQNLGMTLKMSLPHVLDQVFKMALRKSMLSLKTDTNCVPGTTKAVECNTCFCMKNGKLLCTNNVCE